MIKIKVLKFFLKMSLRVLLLKKIKFFKKILN